MNGSAAIDLSLTRITAVRPDGLGLNLARRPGPGDGWFAIEELFASDGAPAVLLNRVRGMYEVPADYIRAEWLFESYTRAIADLGVAFIIAERRLPALEPDNLLMTSSRGLIIGTAVIGDEMTVTATDSVADGHGITRVEGWRELAQELRGGFMLLVEPLVEWMARHRLRQEKTLWLAAADRMAQSAVWSGRAFDDPGFARELIHALIDRPGPMTIPLETGLDSRGDEQHLRSTCCLAYRAAGGGLCFGCPLNR
ncbi:MAG: (2Fe-2S)-binding protein [Solirubrobacterales bacterium]